MYQKKILEYLLENKVVTVKEIARKLNLSEKTIRLKVTNLDDNLQRKEIGSIIRKPSKGIYLKLSGNKKDDIYQLLGNDREYLSVSSTVDYEIIQILLKLREEDFIIQKQVSEKLFISIPTLRKSLIKVDEWLKKYRLTIEVVQKKGMTIRGSEYDKRLAIQSLILRNGYSEIATELSEFTLGLDTEKIKKVIKHAEMRWNIQFSRESFSKIWILISLSLYRNRYFSKIENLNTGILNVEDQHEFKFSESLYDLLDKEGFNCFEKNDISVLAIEIIGASKLVGELSVSSAVSLESQLVNFEEFVDEVLFSISAVLEVNLTEDVILKSNLQEHLKAAIFRMKYGQKNHGDLSKQIKKEYPDVFLSVWSTSQLFERYYGIQATEDELSYITLYIEAALLRKKHQINGVYITDQGRSQSLFIIELLKNNIPEFGDIKFVRTNDIFDENLSDTIVLSNSKSKIKNAISIKNIPDEEDFSMIKNKIETMRKKVSQGLNFSQCLQPIFDPNLIFMKLDELNKEKIIRKMTNEMEKLGAVSPNFFDSVWSREQKTSTCIGYATAIPHGNLDEVNEPKIAVAVLKKPIDWFSGEQVDIVFLLATKMNNKKNIERTNKFYVDLIQFTENSESNRRFRELKDGLSAYKYLFT